MFKQMYLGVALFSLCVAVGHGQAPPEQGKEPQPGPPPRGDRGSGAGARRTPGEPMHPRWEYAAHGRSEVEKLGGDDFRAGLNKLGDQGWELVAVEPGAAGRDTAYTFKR